MRHICRCILGKNVCLRVSRGRKWPRRPLSWRKHHSEVLLHGVIQTSKNMQDIQNQNLRHKTPPPPPEHRVGQSNSPSWESPPHSFTHFLLLNPFFTDSCRLWFRRYPGSDALDAGLWPVREEDRGWAELSRELDAAVNTMCCPITTRQPWHASFPYYLFKSVTGAQEAAMWLSEAEGGDRNSTNMSKGGACPKI